MVVLLEWGKTKHSDAVVLQNEGFGLSAERVMVLKVSCEVFESFVRLVRVMEIHSDLLVSIGGQQWVALLLEQMCCLLVPIT